MQVTPSEVAARLQGGDSLFLLDVREPGEHEFVALPGSVLIPLGELIHRADELSSQKDSEIIVYCHHGIRSARAVGFLRSIGFSKAVNLAGGIDRWSTEVDPSLARY
jgi:adenylyltransferase/sulfurtransferase